MFQVALLGLSSSLFVLELYPIETVPVSGTEGTKSVSHCLQEYEYERRKKWDKEKEEERLEK